MADQHHLLLNNDNTSTQNDNNNNQFYNSNSNAINDIDDIHLIMNGGENNNNISDYMPDGGCADYQINDGYIPLVYMNENYGQLEVSSQAMMFLEGIQ